MAASLIKHRPGRLVCRHDAADAEAGKRTQFFTANIRNPNFRRAIVVAPVSRC